MAYSDFGSEETVARSRAGTFNNIGGTAITTPKVKAPGQGIIQKVGAVVGESKNIAESIVGAGASFVKNTPGYIKQDVMPFLKGVASTVTGEYTKDLGNINTQQTQLDSQIKTYSDLYKSGKMSKENYIKALNGIGDSYQDLTKQAQSIGAKANRGDVVQSAFMTGADILSAGSLQLENVAGRTVAEAGGKEVVNLLADEGATSLEKQILKSPVVRELVERNLTQAGTTAMSESVPELLYRSGKQIATGYLLKRPVFYQSNLGLAEDGLKSVVQGHYTQAAKDAGWLGIQMIKGGPIGGAYWLFGKVKATASKLSYGTGSLIDEMSSRIGDGNRTQVADLLTQIKKHDPEMAIKYEDALKVMQESSRRVYGEDVVSATNNLMTTFEGQDLSKLNARDIIETQLRWKQADDTAQTELKKLVDKGVMSVEDSKKYTPVRWDAGMRDATVNEIHAAGVDSEAQWTAVQNLAETMGFSNNQNLMDRLKYEIFTNAGGTGDVEKAIQGIDAASTIPKGVTSGLKKQLADLGYVLGEPAGGRGIEHIESDNLPKLVSEAAQNHVDMFDPSVSVQPQVATLAGFLKQIGLTPEATTRLANQELTKNVVSVLDRNLNLSHDFSYIKENGDIVNGGQAVLTKLQQFVENMKANRALKALTLGTNDKSAVTDLRQLRPKEIVEALSGKDFKLSTQDAKAISSAINKAYREVPLSLRGAGDRMVDWLYTINPTQKYYSRIQSAFRYTYNPFFRVQEGVETTLLSGLSGGNRVTRLANNHLLFNTTREELNGAVKALDDAHIFTSSLYGEGAQDVVLGRLTANITQGQKRDLAGLAMDIAEKKGMSLTQLVNEHPDDVNDALRVIVQYPQKGILASPLAKTLNLVFFPMRYNAKVTKVAADILGKQPPVIQTAVIHGLFKMDSWLKSDEGIQWQSQNADAIQVFNWITPINSIEYTMSLLNGIHSTGDLGSLGGLPFGVVSQVLDSLGVIHLNTPYVNPKTGDVIPKYIPQTTKAQAATALGDLLGTMFTYPGRTLGLPGKQQSINGFVSKFIDTKNTDFIKQDEMNRLTPLQQNWVRVLKGDTSPDTLDSLYSSPDPNGFNYYTMPPLAVPNQPIVERRTGLPAKSRTKSKRVKPVAQPIH